MKFYVKKMDLTTNKDVNDATVLAITDLHYTSSLGSNFLDAIIDKVKALSPTYICFLGDLSDDQSYEVVSWLNNLAKIAPVYFAVGNHDITRYIPSKRKTITSVLDYGMMNDIKNINNLHVLNKGEQSTHDGYTFTGFPYFDIGETGVVISFINNLYKVNLNEEDFNALLVHNPWIMTPNSFNLLNDSIKENTDLILSGHTHNGMVPHNVDKYIPGNTGLYSPSQSLFPEMTRGHVYASDNKEYPNAHFTGAIVPALRSVPELKGADKIVNKTLYAPAIELIRVKKEK